MVIKTLETRTANLQNYIKNEFSYEDIFRLKIKRNPIIYVSYDDLKASNCPPDFSFNDHGRQRADSVGKRIDPKIPDFFSTNESLDAIVAGLAPCEKDSVLAVCGSGDQAFALAEFAGKVYCVDQSPEQIELVKKRIAALKNGEAREFLHPRLMYGMKKLATEDSFEYFSKIANLSAIRNRLPRIEILPAMDFCRALCLNLPFNKVYLSNIIGYNLYNSNGEHILGELSRVLPVSGLVYASNGKAIRNIDRFGFRIDVKRTRMATEREGEWEPIVLEKVGGGE